MDKNKIEVFGRVLSQKEIEHVFLKAKKLQEENKILKEGLQKFRKDYLENLSVGVCRLQEQYGLTSYRREKFINRIRCEDHVRRRSNGRFTVLEKVES